VGRRVMEGVGRASYCSHAKNDHPPAVLRHVRMLA
jgi:hypothetical protein